MHTHAQVWKAVGMNLERVEFLSSSETINQRADEYWTLVMDIARKNNLKRIIRWADAHTCAMCIYMRHCNMYVCMCTVYTCDYVSSSCHRHCAQEQPEADHQACVCVYGGGRTSWILQLCMTHCCVHCVCVGGGGML